MQHNLTQAMDKVARNERRPSLQAGTPPTEKELRQIERSYPLLALKIRALLNQQQQAKTA